MNIQQPYEIQCITKGLKADRNLKLLVGLMAIAFGVWFGFWSMSHFAWIWIVITFLVLFAGIYLLWNVIRYWQPKRMKLIQLLQNKPTEIVWVYSEVTQKLPFGIEFSNRATLYFWLMEKDCIIVRVHEDDIKIIAQYLYEILPHASFGYSKEKEQWYMANPALLLRD